MKTFSLSGLNEFLRRVVALNFAESVWVTAEVAQISYARGNCYMELVEKLPDSEGGDTVAQLSAVVWQAEFRRMLRNLGDKESAVFSEGISIRLRGRADFHERFGLKFFVEDIDLAYSLGNLEMARRMMIATLEKEKLLHLNKQLSPPSVWQRIAVISSETAAGWQDFKEHLKQNNYGYSFHLQLFHVAMQGNALEKEVIEVLIKIKKLYNLFDAVVIVRGGGSRLDLSGFDNLAVARFVATMPLPVLTGIGHHVDETVTDLVAFQSLKTPTAVADFLITQNLRFEARLIDAENFIQNLVKNRFLTEGGKLMQIENFLNLTMQYRIEKEQNSLDFIAKSIYKNLIFKLKEENEKINIAEKMIQLLSIETTLKRGFSLTKDANGNFIKNFDNINIGDKLTTFTANGTIESNVTEKFTQK